jgi:hypothetical protein
VGLAGDGARAVTTIHQSKRKWEINMASITIDQTKAGTVLQAGAETLVSIQLVTGCNVPVAAAFDPFYDCPTAGYLALVDTSGARRRTLVAIEAGNPDVGVAQPTRLLGAAFGSLYCSSVPLGAAYTLVTTP